MRTTSSTRAVPGNEPVVQLQPQPDATAHHKILNLHYALTPSFSSGRGRHGACASKRRDERDHLLQAMVRCHLRHSSIASALSPLLAYQRLCRLGSFA